MGMINAPCFDQQKVTLIVFGQLLDRQRGHVLQRRLLARISLAVCLVFHMRRLKQPHKLTVYRRIGCEPLSKLITSPGKLTFAIRRQPFIDQISAVVTQARTAGIFGIIRLDG